MGSGALVGVAPRYGRLFQARDAATYLGLTEYRVRVLLACGELVALRNKHGRLMGVYERDCDLWLATHRQAAPAPAATVTIDDQVARLPGAGHFT